MQWMIEIYRSAMFKKAVMAVTGLMLFGFIVGHVTGNLKIYQGKYTDGVHQGEYALDVYAEGLREIGAPILAKGQALWIARIGLLLAVGLHIWSAWQLTLVNRRGRPVAYQRVTPQASTYASRTMRWGGVILLFFVVYHILHLTTGSVHGSFEHGKVFQNVVQGFSNPLVSGFYILANLALGLHLYHGLWSLFQSLGLNGARFNDLRQKASMAFALIISLANISFPVAVLTGVVHL